MEEQEVLENIEAEGTSEAVEEEFEEIATDSNQEVPEEERIPLLETLLFASAEPISVQRLSEITKLSQLMIQESLAALKTSLGENGRGLELVEVAGKYQLRTLPKYGGYIRILRAEKPKKLSTQALETLAIIAYRQPIVKSDVEKIRGVDCTPTLKTLLERDLIRIIGHQPTVGQPALYGTTEEFLRVFGMPDLSALPTLRDIGMLENDPGEEGEESSQEESEQQESEEQEPREETRSTAEISC